MKQNDFINKKELIERIKNNSIIIRYDTIDQKVDCYYMDYKTSTLVYKKIRFDTYLKLNFKRIKLQTSYRYDYFKYISE